MVASKTNTGGGDGEDGELCRRCRWTCSPSKVEDGEERRGSPLARCCCFCSAGVRINFATAPVRKTKRKRGGGGGDRAAAAAAVALRETTAATTGERRTSEAGADAVGKDCNHAAKRDNEVVDVVVAVAVVAVFVRALAVPT